MDCRKALLVGLSLLCAGCVTTTGPGGAESRVEAEKRAIAENRAVQESQANARNDRKKVHPETLVAFGKMNEGQATNPQMGPQQKQQLRDQARESYQKALALDPNHKDAYLQLARLYTSNGDETRAAAVYKTAMAKFPKEAVVYYDLGLIQCKKKDWNGAIAYLAKARDLEPENPQICTKLGAVLARAGRCEEGLACLAPCLGKAEACFTVARIMDSLGQSEASKQYLQVALQANPNLQGAQQMLAALEGQPAGQQPITQIGFEVPAEPEQQ